MEMSGALTKVLPWQCVGNTQGLHYIGKKGCDYIGKKGREMKREVCGGKQQW